VGMGLSHVANLGGVHAVNKVGANANILIHNPSPFCRRQGPGLPV
jgi:hypothetical protein